MNALNPGREMQRRRCTFPFEHQNKFVHRDQIKRVVKFGCSAGEHNKIDTIYGKKIWFKCNTVVLADGLNTSNMHIAYEIMLRNHIPCHTKEKEPYTMPLQRRKRWKKMVYVQQRIKIDQCRVHGKYFNVIEMYTKQRARFGCIHILASPFI